MCGLAGFLGGGLEGIEATLLLRRMTDAIAARGPDSDGQWFDEEAGIGLGHRRLAILDLSPAGAQPMRAASGRYVIAFNGEIYNHLDLRSALGGEAAVPTWRGHSDTETLLAGFDAWGIEGTVRRCVGMFAFAVWDRHERFLTLARDRLGEKPLYYGWQGEGAARTLLFGSELKALRVHPAFSAVVSRNSLRGYVRYMAVPGTDSIYTGIHKVRPGTLLKISTERQEPAITTYWSGLDVVMRGAANRFAGSPMEAVGLLSELLARSVRQQMISDVPLGAFLSGGIDSTTVVALMQSQSSRPVSTFSIGFEEDTFNEAVHAKAVAAHLGTDHTELYVTPAQALDVIPRLPEVYDEPFADSSQIPTLLVSAMARRHVTVSLSGDAGDELFCGYNRYQLTSALWHRLERVPVALRRSVASLLTRIAPDSADRLVALSPFRGRWSNPGDKLHKGAALLGSRSISDLYDGMVSTWREPSDVVIGGDATVSSGVRWPGGADISDVEKMMALDLVGYLTDDILTKVDRAAMSVSLETRVPFLDHRVVEFAWTLPLSLKLRHEDGQLVTKWPLRQVLYRHVPKSLMERPKMGFGIPVERWLRGPLRDWAESLLDESRIRREGYFRAAPIRSKWAEHLSGRRNWQAQLWTVLMFQAWLERSRR